MRNEYGKIDVLLFIESMTRMGGTEIVARNLQDALSNTGLSTSILCLEHYCGDEEFIISPTDKERDEYGIRGRRLIDKLVYSKLRNNSIANYLDDFCTVHNVKALINYTYENLEVLPYNKSYKTIGLYHWSISGYEKSLYNIAGKKSLPTRIISNLILGKQLKKLHRFIGETNYAVTLTERGAKELKEIAPYATEVVIPNFLPYNAPSKSISNGNNRRAIFVGRLSREKGVYHLIDIWQKVASAMSDVTLDIYGEGDELEPMKQIISEYDIPRISFQGFERDPEKIYRNADILLCTSETEGFGMVLIEAMYFGVVPLAFDCPVSPKELITDAGITIECFDTEQYAKNVITLFSDLTTLNHLRKNGQRRASNFYKNKIVTKWLNLIEKNI